VLSTQASSVESAKKPAAGGKAVKILNEDGSSVLDVEGIEKAGDRLCMKGKLMGSFSTNMYLDSSGFYRLLAMMMRWSTLTFALLSPVYWFKSRRRRRGH